MIIKQEMNQGICNLNTNLVIRTMPQEFNQYQLKALQELADYRSVFMRSENMLLLKSKPIKGSKITLQQYMESFIEKFCQNNFADSDYTRIQNKPSDYVLLDEWIRNIDIKAILQCFTYAIWTDKTFEGYFLKKINDNTVQKLLLRLDNIISEHYRHSKLPGTKVTVINTHHGSTIIPK